MNLRNWFDTSLRLRAAEPALEWKGATYTFGDIDARSNRMAHALAARGFQRGDRLAVYLANSLDFIDIFLACVKLGVIFVPVNILYRERELSHILSDAEPKLFVTEKELPALRAEAAAQPADLRRDAFGRRIARRAGLHLRDHRRFERRHPHAQQLRRERRESCWRPGASHPRTGSCWPCRCFTSTRSATGCTAGCSRDAACACWSASSTKKPRPNFWISVRRCFSACRPCTCGCSRSSAGDRARNRPGHAPVRIRLGAACRPRCSKTSANCSGTPFSSATA